MQLFVIRFQYDVPVDGYGNAVFIFPDGALVTQISICIVRVGGETIWLEGLEVTVCTEGKIWDHLSNTMLLHEPM